VQVYWFGPSAGRVSRCCVFLKMRVTAPWNSDSEEIADSSQQSPTLPWLTSFGSISPISLRLGAL
jgi:hypothetical protein